MHYKLTWDYWSGTNPAAAAPQPFCDSPWLCQQQLKENWGSSGIGALFCSSAVGWSAESTCCVELSFPRLSHVLVLKAKPKQQCPGVNSPAASTLAPLSALQAKGSQLSQSRGAGSDLPLSSEVKVAGTGGPEPPQSLLLQMLPWTHSPGSLSRWQILLQQGGDFRMMKEQEM